MNAVLIYWWIDRSSYWWFMHAWGLDQSGGRGRDRGRGEARKGPVAYKRAARTAAKGAPGVRVTASRVSASAGDSGSQPLRTSWHLLRLWNDGFCGWRDLFSYKMQVWSELRSKCIINSFLVNEQIKGNWQIIVIIIFHISQKLYLPYIIFLRNKNNLYLISLN